MASGTRNNTELERDLTSELHDELGVKCRKWIPLSWKGKSDSLITPEYTQSLNQLNEQRLQTLVDHETREKPSPEISNLEALLIEVLHCVKQSPPARSTVLSGAGLEWIETSARQEIKVGDKGVIRMAPDVSLPYEVEFFAEITEITTEARGRKVSATFKERSELVLDLYEQLVFIYYRRSQRSERSGNES